MSDLKHKNLLNIMTRMRSLVCADEAAVECVEVDWTVPRHFGAASLEQFTELGHKLAAYFEKTFCGLCGDGLDVMLGGITECFAKVLSEQINAQQPNSYFLPVVLADRKQAGFIHLPFETCTLLIRRILGDLEAQIGQEGALSGLEESILQDAVFSITDALIGGFFECGGAKLHKTEQLIHNEWPLSFCGFEEMSRVFFTMGSDSDRFELSFYLLDEIVDPLLGIPRPKITPERLKQMPSDIIRRMHSVGIDTSVKLNPATMTLKNVLSLEKDDVVLLDHKITTPANVTFNHRTGFKAWPAKSAGRWAVVIAEKQTGSI